MPSIKAGLSIIVFKAACNNLLSPHAGSPPGVSEQVCHQREQSQADPGRGCEVTDASLEGLAPHGWPVHTPL